MYIYIYIYGQTPCSANLPSNLTCMDSTKHIRNHSKPMEMQYFAHTDHAQGPCHELEKKFKFVTWTLSVALA